MSALRWWIDGPPTPLLAALERDPDAVLAGPDSTPRERMGRKRFYRIEDPAGGPALYVKSFQGPRAAAAWLGFARRSRARREARIARRVAERGFAAARPIAWAEERRAGRLLRSLVVIPERPLRDLRAWLSDPATDATTRRQLLLSFAQLTRRLHDAGVDQDDTSPNNFLVDPEGDWVLIDFERCRLGRPLGARRWTLLAKLHRHDLGVSQSDRLRFLRSYLGEGCARSERREAWAKIARAFIAVRRRDARHATRAAFRPGRQIGREGRTWYVKGREQAPVIRLALGPARSRAIWTLCHVFERLRLPALRPVRLDDEGVDLQVPDLDEHAMEFHAAVTRARRRFEPYGAFVREPQWALTPDGAVLLTPDAFRLRL
jgi:hypothetical protein